ncbi:GNAT family N-acetyltransferase [Halopiger djelfimassiliensis]|uniref:GNAT family N-acetyltransferase n=1 Tax=Halopiger djelfimassiliensis TaxID=1293047 RepID=UPI000677C11A|nr:GNAT family N-acetyltransferase [Halopiger djelfimassiliensis]
MQIRPLPADESAVRRYVEQLWLPYHRDLETTIESHGLADEGDIDLVAAEVAFRLGRLEDDDYRLWIAVDTDASRGSTAESGPLENDGDLAGFVGTEIDDAPSVFDRPDRLVVGDLYVREPYRGSGLARDLIGRAAKRAGKAGCPELVLDVDVDNDRAIAFYEKLGFETYRRRMTVDVDEL